MAGRRIYLVASSGYPNYGDEFLAGQWLRRLARTEPEAEVWLDCPNPGGAELLLGHLHPNVRFTDTLFRIAWAVPTEDAAEAVEFGRTAARQPGFGAPHRAAGVELLHTVDLVHVLGGGYLNAIWPRHAALLGAAATMAEEFDRPVAATGQGLLPALLSAEGLTEVTKAYTVVDVRDAGSRALLGGGNVTQTGDDCVLDLGRESFDPRDSVSVMMCLQSDLLDGDVEQVAESARATLTAWGVDSSKVGYVEGIPGQDRVVFDRISEQFPGMRFYPFTEVWRDGLPARRGQRWITTRPDLHVLAAATGAWGVAFPVHAGYDDLAHRALVEQGSRWAIGTPGEAAPETHGEAGFGSALEGLTTAKRELAERIYAR
jgi:hypothetical protein